MARTRWVPIANSASSGTSIKSQDMEATSKRRLPSPGKRMGRDPSPDSSQDSTECVVRRAKRRRPAVEIGDEILIRDELVLLKVGECTRKWFGPFIVQKVYQDGVVEVELPSGTPLLTCCSPENLVVIKWEKAPTPDPSPPPTPVWKKELEDFLNEPLWPELAEFFEASPPTIEDPLEWDDEPEYLPRCYCELED